MNKIKKITILGGAGFIGHNLALYLKKNGYKIVCTDLHAESKSIHEFDGNNNSILF